MSRMRATPLISLHSFEQRLYPRKQESAPAWKLRTHYGNQRDAEVAGHAEEETAAQFIRSRFGNAAQDRIAIGLRQHPDDAGAEHEKHCRDESGNEARRLKWIAMQRHHGQEKTGNHRSEERRG